MFLVELLLNRYSTEFDRPRVVTAWLATNPSLSPAWPWLDPELVPWLDPELVPRLDPCMGFWQRSSNRESYLPEWLPEWLPE